jgi:hypothetical protein
LCATSNAGNVALTGLDPNVTAAVSIAAINERGLGQRFSVEQFVGPDAAAYSGAVSPSNRKG